MSEADMDWQDNEVRIECVSIDGLKHYCYPWATETLCGVKIRSKKQCDIDKAEYSCYSCTY